jgi:ABC-type branched-subunit amino acid transport system ATPase component
LADSPVLELLDLHAGYGELMVLRGVTLTLDEGTITAVIGANGAGKSTLLKTVFGIVKPATGNVRFLGTDVSPTDPSERLRSGIVFIPQGRSNFPMMTVHENLEMGAYTRTDRQVRTDIDRMYADFPMLAAKRRHMAGNLSGGEQQVLEMAMALMLTPKLALIDEPSLGLSPPMQETVFRAITHLREDLRTTVLVVEQNAVQALRIADRGVVLELGKISASGSGVEMLEDHEVRRAYLGLPT